MPFRLNNLYIFTGGSKMLKNFMFYIKNKTWLCTSKISTHKQTEQETALLAYSKAARKNIICFVETRKRFPILAHQRPAAQTWG